MTEIEKTSDRPKAKEMEAKPLEYFKPMVGTRHTDPEDGMTYETTEVKTDKQGILLRIGGKYVRVNLWGVLTVPIM